MRIQGFQDSSGMLGSFLPTNWEKNHIIKRIWAEDQISLSLLCFLLCFLTELPQGYDARGPFGVVSHVNDVPIKNLIHVVKTLRDNREEFVVFRFANSRSESFVFRRVEIEAATEEILNKNGIRYQFSEDLKDVWNRK